MRILIAGATGAIGRPLVRRLRANQHEVFALTRSHDSAAALKEIWAEAVYVDALDAAAVRAAVGRIRPDTVINELTLTAPTLHARRNEGSDGTRSQSPGWRQH
jgi:2-alkyl-3-oxoalkanoate reductase